MFVWINHYFWCVEYFLWLVGLENTSTAGEIRARTSNLAQSSQTRLSESDGGSPRPSARVVAQAGGPDFWARGCLAQARWARLSELARLFLQVLSSSRLGEGELAWARVLLAWARPLGLSDKLGRGYVLVGCLLLYAFIFGMQLIGLLYNGM